MFGKFRKKSKLDTNFNNEEILREEDNLIRCFNKNSGKVLKILFGLYGRHKGQMATSSIFYIIKSFPSLSIPIITANVINIATYRPENSARLLVINGLVALLALFVNFTANTVHLVSFNKAKRSVEASLRGAMVRKLQQLSISYHKDTASGKIQSKIMRDVEAVEGMTAQVFSSVLGLILSFVFSVSVIILKNPIIFLFVLVIAPVAAILTGKFRGSMRKTSHDFRKEIEHTSSEVMDMVELIPVTRAHALENEEIRKLTDEVTRVAERGYRMDYVQGMFSAANWVTFTFFQILCLFFTGYMAYNKQIQIGDITLYQSYFNTIIGCISSLMNLLPIIVKGGESINSIGEMLNEYNVESNSGKKILKDLHGNFDFKNVTFNYDKDTPVLKGLDLSVKEGETIALVGESGSGKSTILNLLIGFNNVGSGDLLIDGNNISDIDLRSYRRFISVVPQNTVLFSGTIRENITYGRTDISEEELGYVIDMAKLRSVVDKLPQGLDTKIGEHGDKLSGGQRQRISIARAIIRHPNVIIFDEATSALDSATEKDIQEAINNLCIGRTTFIVAHRLSTIRNADRIAVIKDGRCVEIGGYDELMEKKGEFYALKQLQS